MASITTANRNRAADAVCARANGGSLRAYAGAIPATADAALSGNALLGSAGFGASAFAPAAVGVAVANAITPGAAAATGRPGFARVVESDGATVVFQTLAAVPWIGGTTYAVGDYVVNGGAQYRCTAAGDAAASGGPTGTGASIADGAAAWQYVGPAEVTLTPAGGGTQVFAGGAFAVSALTYTQAAS